MNRKTARENAFILLFEKAIKNDETSEEIFKHATEIRELECDDYVKRVFFGYTENASVIDKAVEDCFLGWRKERVSFVSQALVRLACYEMMFMEDIPVRVSINEAIELSKKYDDEKAYIFVNGVLNSVADKLGRK